MTSPLAGRSLFAYARVLVPIGAALARAHAGLSPWILAAAGVTAACVPKGLVATLEAHKSSQPIEPAKLMRSLAFLAVTLLLGWIGFSRPGRASDLGFPTSLLGLLALGGTLLGFGGPSLLSALAVASPTQRELDILRYRGLETGAIAYERERTQASLDARAEGAILAYGGGLILEASAALFVAMTFAVVALAGGASSPWAWQGAGAFAIAFAAAGSGLSVAFSGGGENSFVSFGGVMLISFVIVAVAANNDWSTTLVGGPMVIVSMLLGVIRPARFPRTCDVILALAAVATGIGVLWVRGT